jgi:hypothetical protein
MSPRHSLLESLELTELHNAEQCLKTTISRITQQRTHQCEGYKPQYQMINHTRAGLPYVGHGVGCIVVRAATSF